MSTQNNKTVPTYIFIDCCDEEHSSRDPRDPSDPSEIQHNSTIHFPHLSTYIMNTTEGIDEEHSIFT